MVTFEHLIAVRVMSFQNPGSSYKPLIRLVQGGPAEKKQTLAKPLVYLLGGDWLGGGGGVGGWWGSRFGSVVSVKKVGVERLILAVRAACSLSSFTCSESSTI